jgi:hypothetical protein
MNALKKLFVASLSLAAVTGTYAQSTTIRIIGSTAFRSAAVTGIEDILNPGYTFGYSGTSGATKASQSVFVGTTKVGGYSVVIKCSWTGSVGGVQTLAQVSPLITNSTFLSETANTLTTAGTSGLASNYDAPVTADVSMSDSFQGSTMFTGGSYLTLVDTKVGVVPFVWAKGSSDDTAVSPSLANVTNMTPLQAKALLGSGVLPLSLLTGTASDSTIDVLAVGRDEDSGTRLDAFAESGFGIFSLPNQYQPTIPTGSSVITGIALYPVNTVNGITYPIGQSGYSSGGTLATTLNTPVASGTLDTFNNKFALIGYFGTSDAANVNGGNNNLTYNGVPYTVTNVQEGKYTFWSYEHLMYRPTLSGTQKTVADQLAQQILTADATAAGLLISSMHVSRSVEGGVVTHN